MPKKYAPAQALGRRGKDKPKTLTPAALQQRRTALKQARQKRHPKKPLPPETIAAARHAAQHDDTFHLPPGPVSTEWPDDDE